MEDVKKMLPRKEYIKIRGAHEHEQNQRKKKKK